MKGLHALTGLEPAGWAHFWFAARQQRRGRRHILRIPGFTIDRDRVRVPYNWRGQENVFRERIRPYRGPRRIRAEAYTLYTRMCSSSQSVNDWMLDENPGAHAEAPRGYCDDCWHWYMTHRTQMLANQERFTLQGYMGTDWQRYVSGLESIIYTRSPS